MNRKPYVAGRFYPADAETLRTQVLSYLRESPLPKEKIFGVLMPHAGYVFSGRTAGEAVSRLKHADFDTVLIFGTAHSVHVDGAALMKDGFYETPLGGVKVDGEISQKLLKKSGLFENNPHAHEHEHSVEVVLPFFQVMKRDFKIVPLVVNSEDEEDMIKAGKAAAECLAGRKALVCASSDLSHYPPADVAQKADMAVLEALKIAVRNGDLPYFHLANELVREKARYDMDTSACGQAAILAAASACAELGADDFRLAKYTHSGAVSKDESNVVGYGAGLFVKSEEKNPRAFELSEEMKKDILRYARRSISGYLRDGKAARHDLSENYRFNIPAAVFVTLTMNGNLRGCIGTMEPKSTLLDAVTNFAVNAAFRDPRFPALRAGELERVKIEISLLSPMKRAASHEEVIPGKHGVYVKKGISGGTYLPQVWEHFKTREEFLTSLCADKAGLEPSAWKEKSTALFVYTVDSFKE